MSTIGVDSGEGLAVRGDRLVSVLIPVFDEVDNVRRLHREIAEVLDSLDCDSEILFVDDGSRDGTVEVLEELTGEDPRTRVLCLTRNNGQTAALQAGFDHALGDVIVTLDGDGQNDPRDIPRLLAEIDRGYDLVSGWRRKRKDRWLTRRLPSQVANRMLALLTGIWIHDHGCALKAYRKRVAERTVIYSDMHRFVVAVASLTGGRFREIEVNHRPRVAGRSKYGLGRVWKSILDMLVLVTILRFTTRPAHWFLQLGFPFSLAAIGFLVGYFSSGSSGPLGGSVVLAGGAILCAFAAGHFVLLAVLGELVTATGDHREIDSLLATVRESERV